MVMYALDVHLTVRKNMDSIHDQGLIAPLPVLPVKRTVLFPGVMLPLSVGRSRSVAAVEASLKTEEKTLIVVTQRDADKEDPTVDDLFTIGTKAVVKQVGRTSEGVLQAFLQGIERPLGEGLGFLGRLRWGRIRGRS